MDINSKKSFARVGNDDREPIVFDVQLQGKPTLENLTLPIVPKQGKARLSAIEVVRNEAGR